MENLLNWRDLSSEEILDVAYLEHHARVKASYELGNIAFMHNPLDDANLWNKDFKESWDLLLHNEISAQGWLEDMANIRGLSPAPPESIVRVRYIGAWIQRQLTEMPGINISMLAAEAQISLGYLSALRSGSKKSPSPEKIWMFSSACKRIKNGSSAFSGNLRSTPTA